MPEQELQTITYDDFEQSLKEDGIEIIYPEEDEEKPEGIGAIGYTARLTAPSTTNPYYLKYGKGGYNRCILISGNSCLPNCVGYVYGRALEIGGATANAKLPTCNAEDWLAVAKKNGLNTGNTPKIGATIVWKSGNLWNGLDGCGHVGTVEDVAVDGTITVSQSNYGGTRFFLTKHKPPYNILGQTFIGFIYNPYLSGGWQKDAKGWWYKNVDGSYPADRWSKIDGKWYHFNAEGYMQTGWLTLEDGKYYLGTDGAAVTGWKQIGDKWYYFDENCRMKTGWLKSNGTWYYLMKDGTMAASRWLKYNNEWYFLGKNGEMFTGLHNVPVTFDKDGKFIGYIK